VITTGIYCRPACSSRRPNPENVRFYASYEAAEAAGLRACLRCRPRDVAPAQQSAALVAQACRRIEGSETPPRLDELAREAGLSPFHFHRLFRKATGLTPRAYGRALRERRLSAALRDEATVTDAIYAAGYGSAGRFYEAAGARLGMTPTRYRAGGAHEDIRFAVAQSALGAVLVAESARGVCAISLGDDPEALTRELQDRFPAARLTGDDPAFQARVAQVVAFVEAPGLGLDLPLDIRGTAFQQRVWQALRAVPPGETLSYAALAARIGAPAAVRAVAGACAANTLAVAVPCHRIVRADGSLSGYRWGVERKAALLKKEKDAG
jgi:AraC family transcriptional regulator of adaptative response/methylated-DNA-[protein]-cysteine methyltransferase